MNMFHSSPRLVPPRSVPCTALTFSPSQSQLSFTPMAMADMRKDSPRYPLVTAQKRGLSLLRSPIPCASPRSQSPVTYTSSSSAYSSSGFDTPTSSFSYDPSGTLLSLPSTPLGSPALSMRSEVDAFATDSASDRLCFSPSPPRSATSSSSSPKRSGKHRSVRKKVFDRLKSTIDLGPTSSPDLHTERHQARSRKPRSGKSRLTKAEATLPAPLSILTNGWSTPVKGTADFVSRPIEQRRQEAIEKGRVMRAMNCFILYRRAYSDRASQYCQHSAQPCVSDLLGKSWRMETDEVRKQYRFWANQEVIAHRKAFPEYTYRPSNYNRVSEDDLVEEVQDESGDGGEGHLPSTTDLAVVRPETDTPASVSTKPIETVSETGVNTYTIDPADEPLMTAVTPLTEPLYIAPEAREAGLLHPKPMPGFPGASESIASLLDGAIDAPASSPIPTESLDSFARYDEGAYAYTGAFEMSYGMGEPLASSSVGYIEQPRTRFWQDIDELAQFGEQVIAADCVAASGSQGNYIGLGAPLDDACTMDRGPAAGSIYDQNDATLFEFCTFEEGG